MLFKSRSQNQISQCADNDKPAKHIKTGKITVIACLLLAGQALVSPAYAGHPGLQFEQSSDITDRVIIKYKNNSSLNSINALAEDSESNAHSHTGVNFKYVRRNHEGAHVMKLQQHQHLAELSNMLNALNSDPDVEYAEADLLLKPLLTPNDPRYNEQWGYYETAGGLNLPAAWDMTRGAGAVIAVVDTGYRPHIDLVDNILPGYDMISSTSVSQDGNRRDSDATDPGDYEPAGACGSGSPARNSSWHGTHVSGTIAAVGNNSIGVTGVAYQAKILPVRALGRCGGYMSDIADAIIWAAGGSVSGVPANANPADVINLSLGGAGNCSNTQQSAINKARSLGATIVVAAGNENRNASSSTPANCNGVVVVAATNRSGGKASYSNYGSVVDVAAPGGQKSSGTSYGILSTINSGRTTPANDSYGFYQGTSMATPHIAGVAALLYATNPSITPTQVEQILKSTARPFPSTCSQCGSGIADAFAAVNAATGNTPTPPPAGGSPSANTLVNGVAKTGLSDQRGSQTRFTIDVPAGASNLKFDITGGSGDADLYIKFGSAPTSSSYDCRPYINGNRETCNISTAQAGTYHVMLVAYSSYSGVSLVSNFAETGGSAPVVNTSINETGLSAYLQVKLILELI